MKTHGPSSLIFSLLLTATIFFQSQPLPTAGNPSLIPPPTAANPSLIPPPTAGNPSLIPPPTAGNPSLIPPPTAGNPSLTPPPTAANDTEFIRTSCQTTLYPKLCYTSLAGHANAIQQDPGMLARVAIRVTLSNVTRMAKYVSVLSRQVDRKAVPRTASAVSDCFSVFSDAVGEIRDSLKQMRRLDGRRELRRFQLSNVQTWMSAALTNEDTCTDGFEGVEENSWVKGDVCGRVVNVAQVTSNALALVNSYAAKVPTP